MRKIHSLQSLRNFEAAARHLSFKSAANELCVTPTAVSHHIKKLEVLEYPELGMEAIWKIEVEDFPAYILVDDKGNDFFASIRETCSKCAEQAYDSAKAESVGG